MKHIIVNWKKELKNCVPFYICVNGMNNYIIKRGEMCHVEISDNTSEITFIPKAPRWFGWKALKLYIEVTEPVSEIHLAVQIPGFSLLGELGRAANVNNQLHCFGVKGLNVTGFEYIKKYPRF